MDNPRRAEHDESRERLDRVYRSERSRFVASMRAAGRTLEETPQAVAYVADGHAEGKVIVDVDRGHATA